MQKLFENWRQYIKENIDELEEAKELLRGNNYLSKYADELTEQNLVDAGQYIFLFLPDVYVY